MNAPERWSRFKYRGRNEPKGPRDALERAKLELGLLALNHEPRLLILCPCDKCVEENIIRVATEFNSRVLVLDGAPRKKTVVENLRRARDAVRSHAEALIALDDYSRDVLHIPDRFLEFDGPVERAYKTAEAMYLPRPETEDAPASDGLMVERLLALEWFIDRRLSEFIPWDEDGEDVPADRGGNTSLLKERFGPPLWYLVRSCWFYFENCRSGEATASEGGPFLRFVNCVYEYATGKIEENSSLSNWAKKLARPLRHHDNLLKKLGPLEVELDDLRLDPPSAERDARIAQLEAELPALREEVCDALLAVGWRNFKTKS